MPPLAIRLGMHLRIKGALWMVVDLSACGSFVTVCRRTADGKSSEMMFHAGELGPAVIRG